MTAKRLGSVLSNVTGTAGQILRVKEDESGFEFTTPVTIPSYTVTNDTTDRVLDCTDSTIDEIANVLGTLIKDVSDLGASGGSVFQWSTSEQVWPFEKASNGSTLYAKEINFGSLPDTGVKQVAHNISNLLPSKVHNFYGIASNDSNPGADSVLQLGYASAPNMWSNPIVLEADNNYINVITGASWPASYTGKIRIIYAK